MGKQYQWVWNGENAEKADERTLRGVRKLLLLDGIDEPDIVRVHSQSEYELLTKQMMQEGWQLEETDVKGNPQTTCWVKDDD